MRCHRQRIAIVGIATVVFLVLLVRFWPQIMRWIEQHVQWLD
jgi:hypothetical protein